MARLTRRISTANLKSTSTYAIISSDILKEGQRTPNHVRTIIHRNIFFIRQESLMYCNEKRKKNSIYVYIYIERKMRLLLSIVYRAKSEFKRISLMEITWKVAVERRTLSDHV